MSCLSIRIQQSFVQRFYGEIEKREKTKERKKRALGTNGSERVIGGKKNAVFRNLNSSLITPNA